MSFQYDFRVSILTLPRLLDAAPERSHAARCENTHAFAADENGSIIAMISYEVSYQLLRARRHFVTLTRMLLVGDFASIKSRHR
jgi:hypothetical protein